MQKLNINYKITIYDYQNKITYLDNLFDTFKEDTLFPDMIETLVKKNNIQHFQIHVENLKTNTWEKIIDNSLSNQISGDNYHFRWLNYKIGDIQKAFNLFDNKINIIIDGPGIGRLLSTEEGISFYINNNEKDRHRYEPHVHCKYAGEEMRIKIDTLTIMKNDTIFKNKKKAEKAIKWIAKNQEQLLKYYNSFAINEDNSIKFEIHI